MRPIPVVDHSDGQCDPAERGHRADRSRPVRGDARSSVSFDLVVLRGRGLRGGRFDTRPVVGPPGVVLLRQVAAVRAITDCTVDRLSKDVGLAGVPVRLGDHVDDDRVQRGVAVLALSTRARGRPRRGRARRSWRRRAPSTDGGGQRCRHVTRRRSPTCRGSVRHPRRTTARARRSVGRTPRRSSRRPRSPRASPGRAGWCRSASSAGGCRTRRGHRVSTTTRPAPW